MKVIHFFTIVFLLIALFSQCTKEHSSTPSPYIPPRTTYEYLTGKDTLKYKAWQLSRVLEDSTDITHTLPACERDDIYHFRRSGQFKVTYGANRCGTEPDEKRGSFRMDAYISQLFWTLDSVENSGPFIEKINDDEMIMGYYQGGSPVKHIFTAK